MSVLELNIRGWICLHMRNLLGVCGQALEHGKACLARMWVRRRSWNLPLACSKVVSRLRLCSVAAKCAAVSPSAFRTLMPAPLLHCGAAPTLTHGSQQTASYSLDVLHAGRA